MTFGRIRSRSQCGTKPSTTLTAVCRWRWPAAGCVARWSRLNGQRGRRHHGRYIEKPGFSQPGDVWPGTESPWSQIDAPAVQGVLAGHVAHQAPSSMWRGEISEGSGRRHSCSIGSAPEPATYAAPTRTPPGRPVRATLPVPRGHRGAPRQCNELRSSKPPPRPSPDSATPSSADKLLPPPARSRVSR